MSLSASRKARVDRQYRELRKLDMDTFHACIQGAEAIGHNHRSLDKLTDVEKTALMADIERSLVDMALRVAKP